MSEQRHAVLAIHAFGADHELEQGELLKRRQILRRTQLAGLVILLLLALGAGRTLLARDAQARALAADNATQAVVYVKTTRARSDTAATTLTLPGTLQGQVQAPIAARASGYLQRWHHDIGSRVAAGTLLAEIDTPEIDQQLSQAMAARDQAAASLQLARSTVERWEGLRRKDVVSQQELDEKRSAAVQAQANLAAADANVQRLRQTEGFKRVTAPFAGVITRRNVDVGDLIDAGGGAARALFTMVQTDPLRVTVNVPQSYAQRIKPGLAVVVTQAELRGQRFAGQVARTAGAIDATTRTLPVEVQLPNRDGLLLPGAFVRVQLPVQASAGADDSLRVSTNVLLFRPQGVRVAVLDAQGRVTLRAVTLGRNFGDGVEVLDGLSASDTLVLNPPDSIADGDVVSVVADKPAAAAAASSAASGAKARP